MAFKDILPPARKADAPAVMSISWRGKASLVCNVTLRKALVDIAGLAAGGKVAVGLGDDDDAGKLAISPIHVAHFALRGVRAGSLKFDFPAPACFGGEARGAAPAEAEWRPDIGAIVVTIPPAWLDHAAPADGAARKAKAGAEMRTLDQAERAAPQKAAATVAAKPKAPTAKASDTINGVTIDPTPDAESVTFNGKTMEVTAKQARLVALLARPRPAPVALSFLVNALWDGKPPATAGESVKQIAADLQKALSPIGLDLRLVKGVGYQLKDL